MNREPGLYFCKVGDEWTVGRLYGYGEWELLGYIDYTIPDKVGDRIPMPEGM